MDAIGNPTYLGTQPSNKTNNAYLHALTLYIDTPQKKAPRSKR